MLFPSRVLRAPPQKWTSTLKLPKSSFPARPTNLSAYLKRCTDELYAWQLNRPNRRHLDVDFGIAPGSESTEADFVLHDGPPYANGSLHVGHALNKILKDIICRYQVSQGKRVSYIPGWDCHGLPIEIKALQALEKKRLDDAGSDAGSGAPDVSGGQAVALPDNLSPLEVRRAARKLAGKTVEEQKKTFREWAIMGDWDRSYKTMDKDYVMRQLRVFSQLVDNKLIHRQNKPVYWSPSSGTALAEAELEYDDNHKSTAAFIKFPLAESPLRKTLHSLASAISQSHSRICAAIWTTTPWTLPANKAIAVHADIQYALVYDESDPSGAHDLLLIAESRIPYVEKSVGRAFRIVKDGILGSELADRAPYHGLFPQKLTESRIIHADFVSEDSGTGLVHMAPGHGMDDYNACGQPSDPLSPVDDKGRYTGSAFPAKPEYLEGLPVLSEGNSTVLKLLSNPSIAGLALDIAAGGHGFVLASHEFTHKYPIDWRTKQPVIIRATPQWFADVDKIKPAAQEALSKVTFIPRTGTSRLSSFIEGRSQWCISRQRAWGVPIPALYRTDNGSMEAVMNATLIEHIMGVIKERGIDSWWTDTPEDSAWVPAGLEGTYIRGKDTMDVWFDSGTSWTMLPDRGNESRADVYLEGTDQHRGWFQSSLLTQIGFGHGALQKYQAPYKTVITHGFTLDQNGRKMSKSLGNTILPHEIVNGTLLPPLKPRKQKGLGSNNGQPTYDALGPDTLRLWVASSDYTKDVAIGQSVLQAISGSLHKYRITFKWLLGVLKEFDPAANSPSPLKPTTLADALALRALAKVTTSYHEHFAAYEFFRGVNSLNRYISQDLSAFYFETLKDRIYAGEPADRLSAQQVLYIIFSHLLEMLAPVCPLLVEETWEYWLKDHAQSAESHPARRIADPFSFSADIASLRGQSGGIFDNLGGNLDEIQVCVENLAEGIKAGLERARTSKDIGSSIEAEVWISLSDEVPQDSLLRRILQPQLAEELAALWVVSRVVTRSEADMEGEVKKLSRPYNSTKLDDVPGLNIYTVKATRDKCQRCWRYVVEEHEEGGICGRCDAAVHTV